MHGPVLVSWLLAALTAASGAYCLTRLRRSPCTAHGDRHGHDPHIGDRHDGDLHKGGAGRSGPGRGVHRLLAHESDAAEALMGLGMAAMAVTGGVVPAAVWAWLFGVPAVAFLLGAAAPATLTAQATPATPAAPAAPTASTTTARRTHRLHHAIGALAMTYTALAMAAVPAHAHAHAHHTVGAGTPLLTGMLLLYFGGYSLWAGSRLLTTPAGGLLAGATGLTRACRLSMGIGMFAMLLTM
ncbi:DUF5134 domain-containing protein [Kitasatospora sp. NPDC058170]|uniref:DUF5134 domain-containing protein n=1 Tax=Kitasatospora sp. NPDC058170 TaxID=3346364 RepID=UPI0036D84583